MATSAAGMALTPGAGGRRVRSATRAAPCAHAVALAVDVGLDGRRHREDVVVDPEAQRRGCHLSAIADRLQMRARLVEPDGRHLDDPEPEPRSGEQQIDIEEEVPRAE